MKPPVPTMMMTTHLFLLLCLITSSNCNSQEKKLEELRVSGTPLGLALKAIDSLKGSRLYASGQTARAVALSGDLETALVIVNEYQPEIDRDYTVRNIAQQLVENHSTAKTVQSAMSVDDSMFRSHVAWQLINAIEQHETQFPEILKLVESIPESTTKDAMLSQLAKSRLKLKDVQRAKRISEKIQIPGNKEKIDHETEFELLLSQQRFKEAAEIIPSLDVKDNATSRLIHELSSKLTPVQLKQFVDSVDVKDLKIQLAAIDLMQIAHEKKWDDLAGAVKMFPDQHLAFFVLSQRWSQDDVKPDADFLVQLAKVFDDDRIRNDLLSQAALLKAGQGKIHEAESISSQQRSLTDVKPRLLLEFVKWGFQSGERDVAIEKISEYENLGTAIDSLPYRSGHWGTLIHLLADLREYRLALEVADRAKPMPEQTIESIVKDSFDLGTEKSLLENVSNVSADLKDMVLSLAAKQMVQRGKESEAVEVALSISKKTETRTNVTTNYSSSATLWFIVSELIRKEQYLKKDGVNRIGPAFPDNVRRSELRIPLAWAALKAIQETDYRVELQIELLSTFGKAADPAMRDEIVNVTTQDLKALIPSLKQEGLILGFAYALLSEGLIDEAKRLAEDPNNRTFRDRIVAAISASVAIHEGVKTAEPLLQSIDNAEILGLARFNITQDLISQGNIDEAIQQTELVSMVRHRVSLYQSIFDVLCNREEYEKAAAIAQRIDDVELSGELESKLVGIALSNKDIEGASQMVFSIESRMHRETTLIWLTNSLCFEDVQADHETELKKMKQSFNEKEKKIALLIEERLLQSSQK